MKSQFVLFIFSLSILISMPTQAHNYSEKCRLLNNLIIISKAQSVFRARGEELGMQPVGAGYYHYSMCHPLIINEIEVFLKGTNIQCLEVEKLSAGEARMSYLSEMKLYLSPTKVTYSKLSREFIRRYQSTIFQDSLISQTICIDSIVGDFYNSLKNMNTLPEDAKQTCYQLIDMLERAHGVAVKCQESR